jgi:hypothetical protein
VSLGHGLCGSGWYINDKDTIKKNTFLLALAIIGAAITKGWFEIAKIIKMSATSIQDLENSKL